MLGCMFVPTISTTTYVYSVGVHTLMFCRWRTPPRVPPAAAPHPASCRRTHPARHPATFLQRRNPCAIPVPTVSASLAQSMWPNLQSRLRARFPSLAKHQPPSFSTLSWKTIIHGLRRNHASPDVHQGLHHDPAPSPTPPASLHRRWKGAISAIRRPLPPQMPPWMAGAADFASIPLGPLRAQPAACPRMADPPPPPPTSMRQHPILARSAMPSLGPLRARANHRSPARSTDPHPPQILPANQIPMPAAPRLGCSTSIPRPARLESRSPAALLQNGIVSARGHLSSLSLPLLHLGVLVKQRRWLCLLLVFLRGCVQGFSKSLAMTVLFEIRDKTFFAIAVRLLPPSPSRHVACSLSCPSACFPCLSLRASLSRVTA
jgi:hypothetical protein